MVPLFVRLYVAGDALELDVLERELRRRLAISAHALEVRRPGPYAKLPGCQELFLEFNWPATESAAVADVAATLGRGWSQENELSAVWNPNPGASFCDARVRWAEVALSER